MWLGRNLKAIADKDTSTNGLERQETAPYRERSDPVSERFPKMMRSSVET